ncbi:MAG: hypothetical protein JW982_16365 [Spirochaetes bacterium]|nr:hypothetical protein [Spirochaetota bacterium]
MINYSHDKNVFIKFRFHPGKFCLILFSAALILFSANSAFASEKEQFSLIENSMNSGKYYNAITESMRYSFFYPDGMYIQKVNILTGLAYFEGGDFNRALQYTRLSMKSDDEQLQAEAMHNIIYMRLLEGSVYLAQNDIKYFMNNYSGVDENLYEKIMLEQISSLAYQENFNSAMEEAKKYRNIYPDGKYIPDLEKLETLIHEESVRPLKKTSTALWGSVFIPGFSHFYTGNYMTGTFSFLTNALFIGLITNAVMNQNYFEMVIFSFMELSFYQNSLFSSYNNVETYNSRSSFKKEIKLQMERRF